MERNADPPVVEFGRTRITAVAGELVDQPVEAIIYPANSRGVMPSSGRFSLRSQAGSDVERTLRGMAPLELGTAVVTDAGNLQSRGIRRVIHAIITDEPGAGARLPAARGALATALRLAQTERIRSLAIPMLGMEQGAPPERRALWIDALVDELVAHLRRDRGGLDLVVLASRYPDDQERIGAALIAARAHSWTS